MKFFCCYHFLTVAVISLAPAANALGQRSFRSVGQRFLQVGAPREIQHDDPYENDYIRIAYDRMRRFENRLEQVAGPEAGEKLDHVIHQFQVEKITLDEAHASLRELVSLIEDEALAAEFVAFLEAPMESEDDRDAARAAFCELVGLAHTYVPNPYIMEHWSTSRGWFKDVSETAHRRWEDDPIKALIFVFKVMGPPESDDDEARRAEVMELAADDPELFAQMEVYYTNMDDYNANAEAVRDQESYTPCLFLPE